MTQAEKGNTFRDLHRQNTAFIIPNPWDIGTARLLASVGFEALATTSAGYAFSIGQRDGTVGRDTMLSHLAAIATATDLPVSADLENGFGDSPARVAETLRLAVSTGIVGASIEDASGHPDRPIYDIALAGERISAGAAFVRTLPFPFTLTARAENYLHGHPNLKDTIQRLQAYQQAGADVLYAPGLTSRQDIASVVSSLDKPVNVLMASTQTQLDLASLSALGVKRVSVGSALSRTVLGAFIRAAQEMRTLGTFTFTNGAIPLSEINARFTTTP